MGGGGGGEGLSENTMIEKLEKNNLHIVLYCSPNMLLFFPHRLATLNIQTMTKQALFVQVRISMTL